MHTPGPHPSDHAAERDRVLAEVFDSLPYLIGAAARIAPHASHLEHEEMVQSALVKLFEVIDAGTAPIANPLAYTAMIMRNARANELRSARANTQSWGDLEELPAEFVSVELPEDRVRGVELRGEFAMVRRALASLSPEHRLLLQRVVIEGRKPRELVEEFGREAPAISSALARAKAALRRSVLVDLLSEGAEECAENARRLPDRVRDDVAEHRSSERGIAHVECCDACRAGWRRFAGLVSALGVLPLLVASLQWDAAGGTGGADEAKRIDRVDSGGGSRVAAVAGARWIAAVGAGLLVVAAALVGAFAVANGGAASSAGEEPELRYRFDAASALSGSGEASIHIDFAVLDRVPWRMRELSIELPEGAGLVAASGWSCRGENPAICVPGAEQPGLAVFGVELRQPGGFTATFTADAGGAVLQGSAWNTF